MTETLTTEQGLVEGQIYRWRWIDDARHQNGLRSWGTYHCRSQIAVVKDGRLVDTYWFGGGTDSVLDPSKVELTFFADERWPQISEWQVPYYDAADVRDTRHPNNSRAPIYLRIGAQRSAVRILEEIEYRESRAHSAIRSAESSLELLAEARALLDAGKIDEVML